MTRSTEELGREEGKSFSPFQQHRAGTQKTAPEDSVDWGEEKRL